jgi:hypothetical protein
LSGSSLAQKCMSRRDWRFIDSFTSLLSVRRLHTDVNPACRSEREAHVPLVETTIAASVIGRPCTSPGGVPAPNPPTGVSPVTSPGRCGVFRSVTAASSGAARPCGGQQPHPCSRPRRPAWIQVLPRLGAGHDEDPESVATRADLPRSPRQNGCHRPLRRQRPQASRNHGGSCRTRALSVEGLLFVNRADWAHCFDAVASVTRSEAVRSDLLVGACKSCGASAKLGGVLCLPHFQGCLPSDQLPDVRDQLPDVPVWQSPCT